MSSILLFLISAYGLTTILCYSRLLAPFRPKHYFFHCPMCVGFWVGAFFCITNGSTELFNFDVNIYNTFVCATASSGFCYFVGMLVNDGGLRLSKE